MEYARLLAVAVLFTASMQCFAETHDELAGVPLLQTADPDKSLPNTKITLVLDTPHKKETNLLYCATGQLGWNEFIRLAKGPIDMVDAPDYVAELNKQDFDKSQIDEASNLIFFGAGKEALERVRSELKKKFGGAASPKLIPESLGPNDCVIYTYLFKNLEFKTPLYPFPMPSRFRDTNVKWFGIAVGSPGRLPMLGTVKVHDYVSDDDFVVEIRTKNSEDVLLIAEVPPKETLKQTVAAVLARRSKTTRAMLEDGDSIEVPSMNFEIIKRFPELTNKQIRNAQTLIDVTQLIRMKLDERGALLKSEHRMITRSADSLPDDDERPPAPRRFRCDKAFLILMLQKASEKPYFALWIDNAELLVKAEESSIPVAPRTRRGDEGLDGR